jgi:hypothetical protein
MGTGGGSSTHRRRRQLGAPEPSLERPDRRQGAVGELAAQHQVDQTGPPGRMLAAQAEGGLHERFGGLGCGRPASVVGRVHRGWACLAEAGDQPSDGARLQVEGRSDGRAILAGLKALPDGLPNWHRQGTRHGTYSNGAR